MIIIALEWILYYVVKYLNFIIHLFFFKKIQ